MTDGTPRWSRLDAEGIRDKKEILFLILVPKVIEY